MNRSICNGQHPPEPDRQHVGARARVIAFVIFCMDVPYTCRSSPVCSFLLRPVWISYESVRSCRGLQVRPSTLAARL